MNQKFKIYIKHAYDNTLDLKLTKDAFKLIMSGKINDTQISSFLSLLQRSGIQPHHIIGALDVMRAKMNVVKSPKKSMDTCGTGGDGKNSLNVSTATAFVLAACGIPIAKHGNRALTSKCGSADVLKALKINIDMNISKIESCLKKIGICFMFAPNHHPAMKYVANVRQQLGIRTIFNMLGPLLNPAKVRNQIVGVYSKDVFEIYKKIFEKENKNVCLISGFDGNDEISLDGSNLLFTRKNGEFYFDPRDFDFPKTIKKEIIGKNAEFNANRILEIFSGKKDSFYYTVCINSVFGIILNNSEKINKNNIYKAMKKVEKTIKSQEPLRMIRKLSEFTNS